MANILQTTFLNVFSWVKKKFCILIQIFKVCSDLMKFVFRGQIDEKSTLIQVTSHYLKQCGKKIKQNMATRGSSKYFIRNPTLKTKSCHNANFVATGGTVGCHIDNLRCHQWRQSWHYDNSWFSVWIFYAMIIRTLMMVIANKNITLFLLVYRFYQLSIFLSTRAETLKGTLWSIQNLKPYVNIKYAASLGHFHGGNWPISSGPKLNSPCTYMANGGSKLQYGADWVVVLNEMKFMVQYLKFE